MVKVRLLAALILISTLVSAQHDIKQFNNSLNQFVNVRDFCISADGNEAFFTIQSPAQKISQLAYIKKENKEWLEPQLLPFCDSNMYLEPFLSIDGKRLFFVSDKSLNDTTSKKNYDIWFVDRAGKDAPWSEPKNLGSPINTDLNEFYPTVSENNNLYFTMDSPKGLGKDDIYFSQWNDGKYSTPIILSENINSSGYEFNAFVSKKEEFILFTKYNAAGGQGSGDLYISKKDAKGEWQKATNLGVPINTKYMEYCPFYDEENQILYFTSKRNNMASKNYNTISDLKKHLNEGNNGLSKIYMTPLIIE